MTRFRRLVKSIEGIPFCLKADVGVMFQHPPRQMTRDRFPRKGDRRQAVDTGTAGARRGVVPYCGSKEEFMPDESHAAPPGAPIIRRLTIERFRGIEGLTWHPGSGVNVILGGGDVGKTTLLEAIALRLSPTNAGTISGTDYYRRDVRAGFAIEAVVSLPGDSGINDQVRASWPWQWDGSDAFVPLRRRRSVSFTRPRGLNATGPS